MTTTPEFVQTNTGSIFAKAKPIGYLKGEPDECWPWTGSKQTKTGYGTCRNLRTKRDTVAHRVVWELHNGTIPDELKVLHRCDNPICVNPGHLFLGTQTDNMRDMARKNRGGGRNGACARLLEPDVRCIKRSLANGVSCGVLAGLWGVSFGAIWFIKVGRSYADVVA